MMRLSSILLAALCLSTAVHAAKSLDVEIQVYDRTADKYISNPYILNPDRTAIIVIDMWNYHWCMTCSERVGAMVPRMNAVLESARKAGILIIWNPTDVVTAYSGLPQYERAAAMTTRKLPEIREAPQVKFTAPRAACMCGPGISCRVNYGHDAMHPDFIIGDDDLFSSSTDAICTILSERGVKDVIYMGVATNICVFGKPGAVSYLWKAGFNCMLARDLNDAFTGYNPDTGYTLDMGTTECDENLMKAGVACINTGEAFRTKGDRTFAKPLDYVRFAPWGKPQRPYLFEKRTVATLTAPWLDGAVIRYTVDGSEPTAKSTLYTQPLEITETTTVRAAAFRKGKQVSLPSEAYYVKLPDARPPLPDVFLDSLTYALDDYLKPPGSAYYYCMWHPQKQFSYEGKPLSVRGVKYAHGLGFRAPSTVQYALRPEYRRFVGLAGVDDNMLAVQNGRFLAMHSSVVFKVFIDGKLAAESPVMLISQEPWRFDVEIPPGSQRLNIVCTDAGSRNVLDYGNWVDAGFKF